MSGAPGARMSGAAGRGLVSLRSHSWFSFLAGTASPDDLLSVAADLEYSAVALTDHGSLAGAIEFSDAAGRHEPLLRVPGVSHPSGSLALVDSEVEPAAAFGPKPLGPSLPGSGDADLRPVSFQLVDAEQGLPPKRSLA